MITDNSLWRARARYLELLDIMGYELAKHDEKGDMTGIRRCIARTMYVEGYSVEEIAAAVTMQRNVRMIRGWLDESPEEERDRKQAQATRQEELSEE